MKKLILLTSLASLMFTNCSKEDENSNDQENLSEVSQDVVEESNIELSTVTNGISIENSTLISGTPTPNEQTSFSVNETEQSGFQDVGFEIELNVPSNYAGAYLQLISEDGTPAENYYDIVGSSYSFKQLNTSRASFLSKKSSNLSAKSLTVEEEETTTIEVDFDETIPAGSFCYSLCIYDTEGNVSAPQTLCVEVEAWGGNNNLSGTWELTHFIEIENGVSETTNVGEEKVDYAYTRTCNDQSFEIEELSTLFSLTLNFNQEGEQDYKFSREDNYLSDDFRSTCQVTYDVHFEESSPTGYWAYDEEEQKLTLVNYTWDTIETKNDEPYVDPYDEDFTEIGIGFDLYVTRLTSNELILEERFTNQNFDSELDEVITFEETTQYFFTK